MPAQSPAKMPRFQWRFLPSFLFRGSVCKNEFQGNSRMPSRARNFKIDFEGLQFRPPDGLTPWNLTQSFIWMVPRPLSNARTFGQLRPLFKNTDLPQRPPHNTATAPPYFSYNLVILYRLLTSLLHSYVFRPQSQMKHETSIILQPWSHTTRKLMVREFRSKTHALR